MENIINTVSAIVLIITSLLMIIIIALQESRNTGMSGAVMGGSSDSYLGKNRGRTLDATLARITKVMATIFFIITLAVNVVASFF